MDTRDKRLLATYRPGSTHWVGDGFHVRNLFPSNDLGERLSPFLLLDYAAPTTFPPGPPRGVGEHPHRGFETVTLVYQGRVAHRDSAGNAGVIGPGDVRGPARTFSPLELFDLRLPAGAELALPPGRTAAVLVLAGRARVNGSTPLGEAELALLDLEGERVAAEAETTALLLGGRPLGEPVFAHGPFVMSTKEEIHRAIQDYPAGRLGHLG